MSVRVAINGFGRIGRNILRAIVEADRKDIEVIAVNDLAPVETNAHLLRYDSVHGRFPGEVTVKGDTISIGNGAIKVTAIKDPTTLPWKELDIDVALECTGIFTSKEKASAHLKAGAKRVLVSAPADGVDLTVVYGVNHDKLTKTHTVVSNASCTTNCLAPVAKVLNDAVGIDKGFMTTVHSYTNDAERLGDRFQVRRQALDLQGRDQRRGQTRRRAATQRHPRLHRGPQRLQRLQSRSALLDLPHGSDQGDGRHAGSRNVVVRQRVGVLQPHGRYRRRDGETLLN
jgi:glyceraldehyde 3-phosphate dehydrogenase